VIAEAAVAWLGGAVEVQPGEQGVECELIVPALDGQIDLVDEARLPSSARPFVDRFGAPLHAFYRALAVWPEYAGLVWSELENVAASDAFRDAAGGVADCASESSRTLLSGPCDASLLSEYGKLVSVLHTCLNASSQAAVIAAALRSRFIQSEHARLS